MSAVGQHTEFRQPRERALHEVAVKKNKISRSTTYGETIPIVPQRKVEFHYEDLPASPYVEFVFLYRSRDVLKAMGAYGEDSSASHDALQIDNKPLPPLAPQMPPPPQAGPSRLGNNPRLSAPSPSIRGSAAPAPSHRRSESPIDIDALPDNFGPDDVKPRYKRSRDGDRNRQIDLEKEGEEVKNELGVAGVDEDKEVAELERRLAEAKKKAREAKAARLSGGGVKTETKLEQPSSQPAAGVGSVKGKERAPPIQVIDLTGDDD